MLPTLSFRVGERVLTTPWVSDTVLCEHLYFGNVQDQGSASLDLGLVRQPADRVTPNPPTVTITQKTPGSCLWQVSVAQGGIPAPLLGAWQAGQGYMGWRRKGGF